MGYNDAGWGIRSPLSKTAFPEGKKRGSSGSPPSAWPAGRVSMGRGLMHPSLAACPWGLLHLRGHFPAAGKDPHQGLWLTTHWTGACCVLGLGQESGTATAGATASHRARGREEKGFPLRKGDAAACRAREVWGRRTCRQPGLKDRPDLGRAAQHGGWRDELAYRPACRHGADGEGRRGGEGGKNEKKKKHLQSS